MGCLVFLILYFQKDFPTEIVSEIEQKYGFRIENQNNINVSPSSINEYRVFNHEHPPSFCDVPNRNEKDGRPKSHPSPIPPMINQ